MDSEKECIGGAGYGAISGGQLSDETLHRASDSFERTSSPLSCGYSGSRRLGSGIRSGQQSDAWISGSLADVCGTSCIRPREAPVGVAPNRPSRTQSSCPLQLQEETRLEAIQQIGQSSLGECQSGIYLKDLDFFANRLNPINANKSLAIVDKDESEGADPKPKPKRRARKGGRGKGGEESESAAA